MASVASSVTTVISPAYSTGDFVTTTKAMTFSARSVTISFVSSGAPNSTRASDVPAGSRSPAAGRTAGEEPVAADEAGVLVAVVVAGVGFMTPWRIAGARRNRNARRRPRSARSRSARARERPALPVSGRAAVGDRRGRRGAPVHRQAEV